MIEQFPTNIPQEIIQPQIGPETASRFPSGDAGEISLAGLSRVVTGWREWRLRRAEQSIENLTESADVHQVAAEAQIVAGRPKALNPVVEARLRQEDKDTIRKYHTTHAPVTISEQRQAMRTSRRRRSNVRRAVSNYNSEKIYNDGDRRVGTQAHRDALAAERMPWWIKHEAKKADKKYVEAGAKIRKQIGKIERSALGEDIPGQVLDMLIRKKQAKAEKLRHKLGR